VKVARGPSWLMRSCYLSSVSRSVNYFCSRLQDSFNVGHATFEGKESYYSVMLSVLIDVYL